MLLEPIIGYSRVVSLAKIILLVIAGIMIAALIIWPFSSPVNENFKISFSGIEKGDEGDSPKMINPHLQGVDGNNQTYNITATSATQDKDRIILKKMNADINLQNNGWIFATADEGVFDPSKNLIDLKGSVDIFSNAGYEFSTNEAHVDVNTASIYGNAKIKGQGPMGNISADNFYVENQGNRILLTGNVKIILFLGKK